MDWNEKYRPRNLAQVLGNARAVQSLEAWARAWQHGHPKKRAAILSGPPGTGKTVAAHALASDLGWEVVELNASDDRDAEAIGRVATAGALNQTFDDRGAFLRADEGGRKLIIIDEADSVHGREDRGGVRAIVDTIRRTRQPVVLIVNDLYELTRQSSSFKTLCETVKFQSIQSRTIKTALMRIAAEERLEVEDEALGTIAERASGDLRSAINDLQALAEGKAFVLAKDVGAVGRRDVRSTMFEAVRTILKTDNVLAARRVVSELDEDPEFLLQWLSENAPHEYTDVRDRSRAMEALARADLFLARAQRHQAFRLWSYAIDLMSAGVATAKDREYHGAPRYGFPMWLATMGRTRALRSTMGSLSSRLARECHTSVGIAREELIPLYQQLFELDGAFAVHQTALMELTPPEVAMLLREQTESTRVQQLLAAAESKDAGRRQIEPYALGEGAAYERAAAAREAGSGDRAQGTGAAGAAEGGAGGEGGGPAEGAPDGEGASQPDGEEDKERQRSLLDFG